MLNNFEITKSDFLEILALSEDISGINSVLIEKDFWVCWLLNSIFARQEFSDLTFKGGTSLSKAYGLINRFSEDIDLTIDRTCLGFVDEKDPTNARSGRQRDRLLEELRKSSQLYVYDFLKKLNSICQQEIKSNEWKVEIEPDNIENIRFYYPSVLLQSDSYIKQSVLLEFGVRGKINPSEDKFIKSYVEECMGEQFSNKLPPKRVLIRTLSPVRTFWEKATLLHAQYHQSSEKTSPERLARHYYDLSMMAENWVAEEALKKPELLEDVVRNNSVFFRRASSRYDLATPKQLCIMPHNTLKNEIVSDYKKMEPMFFGVKPTINMIFEKLDSLEKKIRNINYSPINETQKEMM